MRRAWIVALALVGCAKPAPQQSSPTAVASAPVAVASTPAAVAAIQPSSPARIRGVAQCEDGPRYQYQEIEQLLKDVKIGSSSAQIRAQLGPPTRCEAGKIVFVGGQYTGPELTAELTLDTNGVVTHIERYGVACRYVEMSHDTQ